MPRLASRRLFVRMTTTAIAAPILLGASRPNVISTLIGGKAESIAAGGVLNPNNPYGVIVGPDKKLYWADFGSNRVLSLDLGTRRATVIAGTGEKGHSGDGGPAKSATLNAPHEVRFDRRGNLFVAERDSHVIRRIDMKTGSIATAAGTGVAGFSGDGGLSQEAQLSQPHSIAIDKDDNLYICDIANHRIRRVDLETSIIQTFAGTGEAAVTPDDAPLTGTPLRGPRSLDIGADGTIYLALREGNKVFAISPRTRSLRRLAGTGETGYAGDGGPALDAKLGGPKGVALSPDGYLYIADTENHVIRKIGLIDRKITTVVGTGQRGDGQDGDPGQCGLARPHGIFVHQRRLYIGDSENHRIRALET